MLGNDKKLLNGSIVRGSSKNVATAALAAATCFDPQARNSEVSEIGVRNKNGK